MLRVITVCEWAGCLFMVPFVGAKDEPDLSWGIGPRVPTTRIDLHTSSVLSKCKENQNRELNVEGKGSRLTATTNTNTTIFVV